MAHSLMVSSLAHVTPAICRCILGLLYPSADGDVVAHGPDGGRRTMDFEFAE